MEMHGKIITKISMKEGVDILKNKEVFCIDENGWIHCPFCKCKTRAKIRTDTILIKFPVFCSKCKREYLIDVEKMNIRLSIEPDAKTQSR